MPLPPEGDATLASADAELEARIVPAERMVVVAHPHPQFGGTMDSHVVRAVCEIAHGRGLGYLRFNFRGVGRSSGTYDSGLGELDDLKAAIRGAAENGEVVLTAGYSFGGWVASRIPPPMPLLLVAPPTEQFDFEGAEPGKRPVAFIGATDDPSCLLLYVKDFEARGARVWWIDGADHIFTGRYVALKKAIDEAMEVLGLGTGPTAV
jgi:hypothetical protein